MSFVLSCVALYNPNTCQSLTSIEVYGYRRLLTWMYRWSLAIKQQAKRNRRDLPTLSTHTRPSLSVHRLKGPEVPTSHPKHWHAECNPREFQIKFYVWKINIELIKKWCHRLDLIWKTLVTSILDTNIKWKCDSDRFMYLPLGMLTTVMQMVYVLLSLIGIHWSFFWKTKQMNNKTHISRNEKHCFEPH